MSEARRISLGRSVTIGPRIDSVSRVTGALIVAATAVFMLIPALLVVVLSFSGDAFFDFPPHSWGFRQYSTMIHSSTWGPAVVLSFKIAVPVAVLSALISVPAVFVIHRSRLPFRHGLEAAALSGVIIPLTAFAVALYGVFVQYGLLGTYIGLVLADTVLGLPLMLVVVAAAMARIPMEYELAAMVAGASRARAWAGITLRLLVPAIAAGGVLAFSASFDEAVLINFLGGPGQETLPKAILDSVRFGLNPVITAIATSLMFGTTVVMLLALRLARSGR